MIQRIQTIWLLLATAAAFLTLKFSFYSGNIPATDQVTKTFEHFTAQSNIFLLILTVAVGIASLIAIFLYKDRKLQFRICLLAILISIINIVLYFLQIRQFVEGNFDLTSILTFIIPIFLILAARGIRKDEKLVKSLDRLR